MRKTRTWPQVAPIAEEIVIYEDDIKQEGSLRKQSLVVKWWRRRWCVLTSQYLYSFKYPRDYRKPTEILVLGDCVSVRSADNEIGQENSFCVVTQSRTFYLVASSAEEKEEWTAAIMNALLPELACRGMRRSLTLFSIGEQDQEDESEDEQSPVRRISSKIIQSFLSWGGTPKAQNTPKLKSMFTEENALQYQNRINSGNSPERGETRIPTKVQSDDITAANVGFHIPALDVGQYPFCSGSDLGSNPCSGPNSVSTPRTSSTPQGRSSGSTPRRCRSGDHLLEVVGDEILISPHAFPSLRLSTPRGIFSPSCSQCERLTPSNEFSPERFEARCRLESVDEEPATATFSEAVDAWQERFRVGDAVQARDYEVQEWVSGVVSCADPLKVQPRGKARGHSFQFVRIEPQQMLYGSECSTDSLDATLFL